ncbi:hypothetical protein FHX42_000971 [Saccharopolyspora lacisalsi]|uniref:Actinobacteria/chloroflexi VLRF1 release factor domain-containing protein n=1 Tax=Halosaccharopolyspora lacisalsi TaxID=1000566 RepID=A0A839DNT8_9PSEU|nr:acVLRF1 family peptidyl-tRNA hydrolase [Halosaccharopolyspora lacisalsi]MBA8823642.1 hypothetical protein [Halosaccharopolyspora lacisalsi]
MSRVRPLAGGGRAVEVAPRRLHGWFERFAEQHGGAADTEVGADRVRVRAVDGALAVVDVPFEPLPQPSGRRSGLAVSELVDHVGRSRRIGLVLVRLGAHSVGACVDGKVVTSSTDRHLVHGRNKAGGWSQQRFARRREEQSRKALESAADAVARVLLPERLDGLVLGGDRQALDTLGRDRRLAALLATAEPRVLDVAEPRRAVLDEAAARAVAVEVRVHDP